MEHPYYYSCSYYHSQADTRRQPIMDGIEIYAGVYVGDGFGEEYCANWVEWLFHPSRYKQLPCEIPNCCRRYCPKLHKGELPATNK